MFAAAGWSRVAMCRLLLARGAHLDVAGLPPGQSLVEACRYHEDTTVLRLLLDAAETPPPEPIRHELADMAERLGDHHLAASLRRVGP